MRILGLHSFNSEYPTLLYILRYNGSILFHRTSKESRQPLKRSHDDGPESNPSIPIYDNIIKSIDPELLVNSDKFLEKIEQMAEKPGWPKEWSESYLGVECEGGCEYFEQGWVSTKDRFNYTQLYLIALWASQTNLGSVTVKDLLNEYTKKLDISAFSTYFETVLKDKNYQTLPNGKVKRLFKIADKCTYPLWVTIFIMSDQHTVGGLRDIYMYIDNIGY